MDKVLFSRHVVVGDGSDANPIEIASAAVLTTGTTITEIAKVDSLATWRSDNQALLEANPDLELHDFGDSLLTPSFVNGHTHLSMSALRGIDTLVAMAGNVVEDLYFAIESHQRPEDVRAFARMGAYESALAGVGCVWDHYYYADQVARAARDVGLSMVIAPTLQDVVGPGVVQCERQLALTEEIDDDQELREAGIVAALGPHATDTVSSELWARCAEIAERRNLRMHAHVGQSFDELERSIERHGCTPVERLRREGLLDAGAGTLMVHMMFVTDQDLDHLADHPAGRHTLAYCPFSQAQFGFPAHVLGWHERGLAITLGTDCGACNDSMSVQGELRILAGGNAFSTTHSRAYESFRRDGTLENARAVHTHRQGVFERYRGIKSPVELLSTIWRVPGRLHHGLQVGEIAVGARANLAVWKLDHPGLWPATHPLRALAFADSTTTLEAHLLGGQWLGTPGELRTSVLASDAYRSAREEASARLAELLVRAGVG